MEIKIIDVLTKAIKQLQFFSSSIEKKEEAYIHFLTKYIDNFVFENKLNFLVLNPDEIKVGDSSDKTAAVADILISENNRQNLKIIECLRISHVNKQVILSHYEKILTNSKLFGNKAEFYIISLK